ncbi:MAG: DUF302 domain-containing protein [Pseudomonadota bacterium]
MKSLLTATLLAVLVPLGAQAADLISIESNHSVAETIDRLKANVEKAGATVFARVDHAKGAASVDQELRPTEMLMFGNPKLGTPAMQGAQTMAPDLPMRVIAWEDAQGKVFIGYRDPAEAAKLHGLPADHPTIVKMQGALGKLTGAAAQ